MKILLIIIIFLLVLFILVFFHELGHFLSARRAGVIVKEFGIGLPPRILGIRRGRTIYSLNLIPLGAFVKTAGERDPSVPGGLASKGPWTRLGIYAAGPLVNIFLAFIFISAFFTLPAEVITGNGIMVHSVTQGSAAEKAGIKPGDIILSVDRKPVRHVRDMHKAINLGGEKVELELQRNGKTETVELKPQFNPELKRRIIGVLLCWGIVTQVEKGSLAEGADIRPGDTLLSINGQPVYNDESLNRALGSSQKEISLTWQRGEEIISRSLKLEEPSAGITSHWVEGAHIEKEQYSLWQAISLGWDYIIHLPSLIRSSIPLIKKDPSLAVIGPVGAGQLTVEAVRAFGISRVLLVAGLISLGLALFNFFPVPPLDGGGMLVAFIEGLRHGKRLSPRMVRLAYTIGTTLLFALMMLVIYWDISRLIGGGGFL